MKLTFSLPRLALLLPVVLLVAGCSGINTSGSVSPLSFFMPGLVSRPAPAPRPAPVETPISVEHGSVELAKLQ